MRAFPALPSDQLTVIAWPSPNLERSGHDARGAYVERYWLTVLGPTATWILRRCADELEAHPTGYVMNMADTANSLGVKSVGPNSPFIRALGRLCQFEIATMQSSKVLAVRKYLPTLSERHLLRLSPIDRQRHDYWIKNQHLEQAS